MSVRIKKALLLTAALIAALVLAEAVLRLTTGPEFLQSGARSTVWPWVVKDPILGWAHLPGYENKQFKINSLGFRGGEISPEKREGVARIVCIGDSGTFGVWFGKHAKRNWDSYPEYLGAILNENGYENTEVINAGVVGYASSHTLRQLMTKVLRIKPDIIVLRTGFNDIADMGHPFFRQYYIKEPPGFFLGWLMYNWPESRLVRLLSWAEREFQSAVVGNEQNFVTLGEFKENVSRIIDAARDNGIDLLIVDYPLRDSSTGLHKQERYLTWYYGAETLLEFHKKHGAYQNALSEIATERGVKVVDIQSLLPGLQEPYHSEYDFVHPDSNGARITALEVYLTLQELGWLENGK